MRIAVTLTRYWIRWAGKITSGSAMPTAISISHMYEDYYIRPALLKSKQYYNNAFGTAVKFEDLMALKKELIVRRKFSDLN